MFTGFILCTTWTLIISLNVVDARTTEGEHSNNWSLKENVLNKQISVISHRLVLYVWSGQDASVPNSSDFVAVIDFDERSHTYGSILRVVPLVSDPANGIGQANNEPHHSSISLNRKYYVTGGLLSFLSKQKEIFVWTIPRNPLHGPTFKCGIDVPRAACTDEFQPIGNSEFLVSMMCNEDANSPGDMVIINADTCTTRPFLKNAAAMENFNPHGYGRLINGSILSADYIVPITLAQSDPSKIIFQNTVRHIFPDGSLQRTFTTHFPTKPGANTGLGNGIGFMELKPLPNDPWGRVYACGTNTNLIYLITPGLPEPLPILDASVVNGYVKRPSSGIISIFPDGRLMLMTFQMRYVMLINSTIPESPKILRTFDFCSDSSVANMPLRIPGTNHTTTFPKFCAKNSNVAGTHVIMHPPGKRRFVVVNYFLKFGLAQFAGTRSVHAFKLNADRSDFTYDHRFNPNFSQSRKVAQTFDSLQGYPHHAQYLKV